MSTLQEATKHLSRALIEPLCEASKKLLAPIALQNNDRLSISLSEDATAFIIQPYAVLGDRAVQASWKALYGWVDRIPEHKQLPGNRWEVSATDTTALIISAVWPEDKIDFQDSAVKQVYDYVLLRFLSQSAAAYMRAAYKINGTLPELPPSFVDHPDHPLAPYQRVALAGVLHQEGTALYMEQGTGKTAPSIARICTEAREHYEKEVVAAKAEGRKRRLYTVLVSCPKNVRANWVAEVNKFATAPGKVVVLRGNQIERIKLLVEALMPDDGEMFTVVISSYETVRRSWEAISAVRWNLCISDESHFIAATYTERTKTFHLLRECCDQRMELTGTPVKNKLLDLWAQLEFLGEGLSGFKSYKKYNDYYGQYDDKKHEKKLAAMRRFVPMMKNDKTSLSGTDIDKYSNIPLLQERLSRLSFMITKREALPDLPEKTYDIIEVSMGAEQRDAYIKLAKQLALEIEQGLESKTITPQNALVRLLRLAQITSGFAVFDATVDPETGDVLSAKETKTFEPNVKVQAVLELMAEKGPKSKTIIWCQFRHDILAMHAALKAAGYKGGTFFGETSDEDRAELERAFNKDADYQYAVGNPAAGGTGINLWGYDPASVGTDADHGCNCDHVIYLSQGWSSVYRSQSEDRAHRRGTRVSVRYTDIVVPNTIDEEIRARVLQKQINAMQLQDIRSIMKRVLEVQPDAE